MLPLLGEALENFANFYFSSVELFEMATNGVLNGAAPEDATNAVLKPSDPVPQDAIPVQGVEFDSFTERNISVAELVDGMSKAGFQATSIGQAVKIVDGMVGKLFIICETFMILKAL